MRKHPRPRIRQDRRSRDWRRIALLTLIFAAALALCYFAGVYWGAPSALRGLAQTTELERALSTQSTDNARLRTRTAFLAQSLALSKKSEAATRQAMFELKAKQMQIRRKLAFYEGIVTGGAGEAEVKIAGLQIIPTRRSREFRFQIVLVHAGENRGQTVSGVCRIVVSGMLDGEQKQLPLEKISLRGAGPMDFTLRYFRNLSGTLRLPAGFTPRKVEISISLEKSEASVSGSYSWPAFQG
ncbi:MAG: hypothetical protein L0I62_06425 [Gammaproteobacteria bacterium]|nr:hypothetical protein [Gammaproteobacteria bacterium]